MPRVVVIGTGTGVGKTTLSVALLHVLRRRAPNQVCVGLKPVETGVTSDAPTDAAALQNASSGVPVPSPHPLYAYPEAVSPHLAARRAATAPPDPAQVSNWVRMHEVALRIASPNPWIVIESAGAVFSPLAVGVTNYDLWSALEPAISVLVAADSLGTLHDTTVTLEALARRGRPPDYVVLSAARLDASTGTNAEEMRRLRIADPIAVLDRNGNGLDDFAADLLRAHS